MIKPAPTHVFLEGMFHPSLELSIPFSLQPTFEAVASRDSSQYLVIPPLLEAKIAMSTEGK